MSFYVWASDMPIVLTYPDDSDPVEIAEHYDALIADGQSWPYFLGQAGQDGAVVVNYAALTGVTVSKALPEALAALPVEHRNVAFDRETKAALDEDDDSD